MTAIAVVGSTDFPLALGAGRILRLLSELREGHGEYLDVVVRTDAEGSPIAGVDALVSTFCQGLGIERIYVALDPSVPASKRGWERVERLVSECDEVIAFFAPGRVMEGGTGMVVTHAMNMGRRVAAWTIDDDGVLVRVGDLVPENVFDVSLSDDETLTVTYTYTET